MPSCCCMRRSWLRSWRRIGNAFIMQGMVRKNPKDIRIDCLYKLVISGKGNGGVYQITKCMEKILDEALREQKAELARRQEKERERMNIMLSFIREKCGPKEAELIETIVSAI